MKITVNGAPHETKAHTLEALLAELDYDVATIATAVNGEFAPASERAVRQLAPGDTIEVVSPRQGG